MRAAPDDRRARDNPVKSENESDCRRRDGKSKEHAHKHRNEYTHKERLLLSGVSYHFAKESHNGVDGFAEQKSDERARSDGNERSDDNVYFRFARHERADFEGDERGYKRAKRFAHLRIVDNYRVVCDDFARKRSEHTHDRRRNSDERSLFEFVPHTERDTRAHHKLREFAGDNDITAYRAADNRADFADYRADYKRREQSERHTRKSVDKDIFQYRYEFFPRA